MRTFVAPITGYVVTGKVALAAPAGMVMLEGTVAAGVFPLERVTSAPPAGARALRATVPVDGVPPRTELGLNVTDAIVVGETVRFADADVTPSEAVTLTVAPLAVLAVAIGKLTEFAPPGTVTVAGGMTSAGLEEVRESGYPAVGAGPLSVTVPMDVLPPSTFVGDRERLETLGGETVSDCAAVTPADVAVTLTNVALANGNVEKVKEAEFTPAGTRTLEGIESTDGALLPRRTVTPPVGATALRDTVPDPLFRYTEREDGAVAGATSMRGVVTSRPPLLPLRTTDAS
jgi:hypothetical protein